MKNIKTIIYIALAIPLLLTSTQSKTLSFRDIKEASAACLTTINNNRKPIIIGAVLVAAYKTYKSIAKKYYAHMRANALDESIRQHLTDAKIAEIARTTDGLSNGDLQGIINKIKTYASITEDGRATPEIINLAVKEYVDKHNAFKNAHSKKKAQ
jgi:hypothetical protein